MACDYSKSGFPQSYWAGHTDRRSVLRGLAGLGLAAGALSTFPQDAKAAERLGYMCWEGYNDPRIVDPFTKANDAELNIDIIVDSPAGFAKIAAGGHRDIDVVSTDVPWVQRMGPAGLCEYLEASEFQQVFDSYYDQFKMPFEPLMHGDKLTGIPTRWGWVGPVINTETSDVDEWRTYDACFDPKNKDKIGIMDWGDWPIMPMALHAGVNPYEELDKPALDEVRKVLRALFKNSRALFSDLSLSQKALLDGSVKTLVGTGTYTSSGLRKAGYKNVISLVPEEPSALKKGIIWIEGSAIVKEPVDMELSKKFLHHLASKEVGYVLSITELTCNPSPNREVETLYSDEERDILQLDYADTVWKNSVLHRVAPNIDDMLAIWQEELAAAN